ncbi:MAG: DUF4350 domain-containing protein [Pseudoxanthomonas sp.]
MNSARKPSRRNEWNAARIGAPALVIVVIVVVAMAWFLHNYNRVETDVPLPPRGEALYNPLFALRKSLEADGLRVQARQRLDLSAHALGKRDTLLLFNDPRAMSPPDVRRVLDWVEGGGHLIVRTPSEHDWNSKLPAALFDQIGLHLREDEDDRRECVDMFIKDENPHVEFCNGRRFDFDSVVPQLSWGDLKNGHVYARLAQGEGRIDVLADMDFLGNGRSGMGGLFGGFGPAGGGLRDVSHRALARQVLAPNYGHGTIHLVYAAQMPSLWRWLLLRGWVVWVPLAIALLAWLWLRARRFGPLQPAPVLERRSLLEHVRASGELLFRHGRSVLLYAAVRQAFLSRLRRRDPVAAAMTGEPQIAALAERFKLPADVLRKALLVPASHDKAAFRDRVSTLIDLRNRL